VIEAFTKPDPMRAWWGEDVRFKIVLQVVSQWKIVSTEGDTIYTASG
jgi:hypothetical protein